MRRYNLHMRCLGVSGVDKNEVDFSFRSAPLFGSLRLCLTNDYSMSNYKQGFLFTRSMAANESGCAFNGLILPTPEILSDRNHELWTKPVSTMRIHLWVLYLLLHVFSATCSPPPILFAAAIAIENRTSTVDLIPLTSFQCYLPSLPSAILRQTLSPYRLARMQSKLSDNLPCAFYLLSIRGKRLIRRSWKFLG